jgi:hypothetical protein
MFKITLTYNSGIENIYTREEETCTNTEWLQKKKERMIDRWLKIIIDGLNLIKNDDDRLYAKEYALQNIIMQMNIVDHKSRNFNIEITEMHYEKDSEIILLINFFF